MVRLLLRCIVGLALATGPCLAGELPLEAWNTPRRGANLFDHVESADRLQHAADAGITIVRLAPDKWETAGRDFLIGDADAYRELVPADLMRLRSVLDQANSTGLQVVLCMLTLPGARWRQHNGNRSDFRLYQDAAFLEQAAHFWRDLAGALRGHPAIAAYNVVNEPHPERAGAPVRFDLDAVYARLVAAIREVDRDTPIVLDAGDFASPAAFPALTPVADPGVIYSFHFYEPWPYIDHRAKGRYRYPGFVPVVSGAADSTWWDAAALERCVAPVVEWQQRHQVAANRILVGEFGCPRLHPGVERWLEDSIAIFEQHGWHWCFYAFREDTWPAMDYELGTERLGDAVWEAIDAGETPVLPRRSNPIWTVIQNGLARNATAGGGRR